MSSGGSEYLAGIHIDQAGGNFDDGLRLADSQASQAIRAPVAAAAPAAVVLVIASELSNVPDDDDVRTEQCANFGCGCGISTVAVGKILLFDYLIEHTSFNDPICSLDDQLVNEQVDYAFTDILIGTENGFDAAKHGAVPEIKHRYAMLQWRGTQLLGKRGNWKGTRASVTTKTILCMRRFSYLLKKDSRVEISFSARSICMCTAISFLSARSLLAARR